MSSLGSCHRQFHFLFGSINFGHIFDHNSWRRKIHWWFTFSWKEHIGGNIWRQPKMGKFSQNRNEIWYGQSVWGNSNAKIFILKQNSILDQFIRIWIFSGFIICYLSVIICYIRIRIFMQKHLMDNGNSRKRNIICQISRNMILQVFQQIDRFIWIFPIKNNPKFFRLVFPFAALL